ncbi:MAG: sensor histidine kinase [Chloroflexota bacterium]
MNLQATEDGLNKIFNNLISNAIKYTPTRGSIRIEVVEKSDQVKVSIADTGIGIPEEALPRLGEEFYRAKNAKKSGITGTGLGLSIVKQVMDYFGGKMDIQSVEGQGTMVTLTFRKY